MTSLAATYARLFPAAELRRRLANAQASLRALVEHNGPNPSGEVARATAAAQQSEVDALAAALASKE